MSRGGSGNDPGRPARSGRTDERCDARMGYGFGIFLLAAGLILALAVQDSLNNVDLTMVGWILALVGALLIVLAAVPPLVGPLCVVPPAVTLTRGRGARPVATTTHADGSQTTTEQQHRN